MLDELTKSAFIRDGLVHYPNARETVDYFQASVVEVIQRAFEEKADWRNFEPRREAGSLEHSKVTGTTERYIQAWIEGAIPGRLGIKAWLSLGLFWRPTLRPAASVVAAASAWTEKGVVVPFLDSPSRERRILLAPLFRRNERRLLLDVGENFDAPEAFGCLLDSADEALVPVDSNQSSEPVRSV